MNCPKCKRPDVLTAAFKEHTDYPVDNIDNDIIDIRSDCGETYDSELIHIHCDGCDTYWYSADAFNRERQ